ncbi:MAG TPA: hypothetical protein ENN40_06220 [Candidatus Aminicenantes bacterium]|nr:hypothetical protein [Candidatus Aminicenantes bacterium]
MNVLRRQKQKRQIEKGYVNTKFIKYTGTIVLIAFITIFLYSELIGHASAEHHPEQVDFCNLISDTTKPQPNASRLLGFAFQAALFSLSENANCQKKAQPLSYPLFSTIPEISRTILFQSFLT